MRKFALVIVVNLLCEIAPAQQIYFNNFYDVAGFPNYTSSVIQKPDSGFIFINTDIGPIQKGYVITGTDKFGDTIFTKPYYYTNLVVTTGSTHSLIPTQDGNYLVSGTGIDTANVRDGWLIKFTPAGDTLWTSRYGGAAGDYINSIYEDSQGDIWGCGSTSSWGNGLSDFWLMRFDSNGILLWDTTFGTPQNEGCVSGELTADGGIIMAGRTDGIPYVVKVNASGQVDWQYAYSNYNGYGYVSAAPDSGYIIACGKIISANEEQGVILKLNSNGVELWNRYVGFANTGEGLSAKPIVTANSIVVSGVSAPVSGYYRGFLAKTDIFGFMLWQRAYTLDSTHNHYVYECLATSDSGYLLAGSTFQTTQNAWLVKVDSMGCEVAGCDAVNINEQQAEQAIRVYPNPAREYVSVAFLGDHIGATRLEIFNSEGKLVDCAFFDGLRLLTISTTEYAEGIYFLRVMREGECIDSQKLVVIR